MGHYVNARYGEMYKAAYEMGLIKELRELHKLPDDPKTEADRIWKNLLTFESWMINTKIPKMVKDWPPTSKHSPSFSFHNKLLKLSNDEIVDLIRNITIFFTYLYDDLSHGLNELYMRKFDALRVINGVDYVRPYINEDMLSIIIQSILFGHSIQQVGSNWVMDEFTFHRNFWVESTDSDQLASPNNEGFFTMTLINESFSINWPKNNPLIVKE
jgi:hypothetical protein